MNFENLCALWKNAAQRIQARVERLPAPQAQTQARGTAPAGAAIPGKDRKQAVIDPLQNYLCGDYELLHCVLGLVFLSTVGITDAKVNL